MDQKEFADVAVLLPTYNEIENITKILTELRRLYPQINIIVIDDQSPDGTGEAAEQFAMKDPRTLVLHRRGKRGLGKAYIDGFERALSLGVHFIVTMDSDFSHQPNLLENLVERTKTDGDIAIGSRLVPGGSIVGWPVHRRLLSSYGNLYARRLLRLDSKDCTSGYRAYRESAVRMIGLNSIKGNGYIIQISLLRRAKLSGLQVVEVPITFNDRVEGQSKMSPRIVAESMLLVTLFGLKDLLRRKR